MKNSKTFGLFHSKILTNFKDRSYVSFQENRRKITKFRKKIFFFFLESVYWQQVKEQNQCVLSINTTRSYSDEDIEGYTIR